MVDIILLLLSYSCVLASTPILVGSLIEDNILVPFICILCLSTSTFWFIYQVNVILEKL